MMESLHAAVKLGMEARKVRERTGEAIPNRFEVGTLENEAFEAGYDNNLAAWMDVRRRGLEVPA